MAPAEGDAPSAPVLTLEQARASTPPAEFESVLEPDSEMEPAPGAPGPGMVQMAAGHRTLDSAAEQAAFVSMSAREREAYRSMGTGNEGADVPRGWRCTVGTSPTREQMLARIREADPGLLVFEDGHPTMEILAGAAMAVAAEAAASAAASSLIQLIAKADVSIATLAAARIVAWIFGCHICRGRARLCLACELLADALASTGSTFLLLNTSPLEATPRVNTFLVEATPHVNTSSVEATPRGTPCG